MAGGLARPARRPCDPAAARAPRGALERGGTRAAGRAVAIGPARALRRADRTGADAVPGELADATRRRTPAPGACQGGDRGPGGRLRVRGGLRARLQAPRGPAASRVARSEERRVGNEWMSRSPP